MNVTDLRLTAWCVVMLGIAAPPLYAEESGTGVPLPGLESDPTGTVVAQAATVSVNAGRVSVDLSVGTVEEKPALLLETPSFGWTGPSDPYPDRQFPELEIRIDGVPVVPDDRFQAFAGGRNITTLLELAEMDPWAVTRTPPVTAAGSKNPQVLKGLANMGAIEKSGDDYRAKWTARRILRIPLKAVGGQEVELNYRARPASSLMTAEQLDTTSREKRYCISPQQLRRASHSGAATAWLAVSELAIPTGIDGKPPTSAALTISQGAGGAANPPVYYFLCGPHGKSIAKKGSVTHERAEVDDTGVLYVLSVAESAKPPAAKSGEP